MQRLLIGFETYLVARAIAKLIICEVIKEMKASLHFLENGKLSQKFASMQILD